MSRSFFARLNERYGPLANQPEELSHSRRQFLKMTLAASAGLLLSNRSAVAAITKGSRSVVVIGAGFSGLACAHELVSAGYDVTVVEARDRIGGRVLSFKDLVKGKTVEGGGELIGSNHPTWVSYAEKFGLEFMDVTEDESLSSPLVLNGKKLSDEEAGALWEQMDAALAKINEDAAAINEHEPWKSPNAEALDKQTVEDWIVKQEVPDLCKEAIRTMLTVDNGMPTKEQSYLALLAAVKAGGLEKYWTDSEVYRCKGGNQQLAEKLEAAIGPKRINKGLAVTSVFIERTGVTVKCSDGRTIEADEVVLATPPTVWERISFSPDLPKGFKPQMGTSIKYLSAVKTRFWKEKGLSPDSMTDGDIGMTWELTDNQEGDENAGLNAFASAAGAKVFLAAEADERRKKFDAGLEALYPGYKENTVDTRFMGWPSEKWTMGGYSFAAPSQVTTLGPTLRNGHANGRLHFAGEHASYEFAGYMEGALYAGATLAKRMVAAAEKQAEPAKQPAGV